MAPRWDIFCTVIDNYGDIGIAWRLARQLVAEHGLEVRLWVDDLTSFAKLRPEIDPVLAVQRLEGVEIRYWATPFPPAEPADVVIEALACHLPEAYVEAMAAQEKKPTWINLEYLSAEDWVIGCHALPSPHPRLPLTKYFFFPGWHVGGGILGEAGLEAARETFQGSTGLRRTFFERLGLSGLPAPCPLPLAREGSPLPPVNHPSPSGAGPTMDDAPAVTSPPEGESDAASLRECHGNEVTLVSLFCYANPAIAGLFKAWEKGPARVHCLFPVGPALPAVALHFGADHVSAGTTLMRGNLTLHVLPMVSQDDYDRLLWACDCNFVRGEDSFVRAQWARAPMVWQAYRQEEGAHWAKIDAFMKLYREGLSAEASAALERFWTGWNRGELGTDAWPAFWQHRLELRRHAEDWATRMARRGDLAANLVKFCSEKAQ